ncbi:uncharacterized protein LOC129586973 isoform X2 [Paramacrobiotus metropolitanus]|uniref:uncharacterized protein LOC129586973 isoform X2 n=1 Tax=Paramacrobiotus metropolitanus TaxID=2943436 RepID=UPI0024460E99|nr:uncharacterized protein LOC129586973 isoform X2 [Paramacrobiotus metropolitanus]
MPKVNSSRKTKARSTSLWMRLKQKPFKTTIIPPETGQSIISIPDAWPQPELPLWRSLEYRNKLPLPSWHKWTLNCGPMNKGYVPKWLGAMFDTWDINVHVYDTEYHPLHDPALRIFCFNRRKILLHQKLITPDGNVRANLRQFNQWRRHLFRYQHQLILKKQALARRDELCDTIRGFLHDPKKTSIAQDIQKDAADVTDEQANSRYREGDEFNALLVELSKLHDLSKQVRIEILQYMRKVNIEISQERESNRQLKLLQLLCKKDHEAMVRRHYQKVILFTNNKKKKAATALEKRMKSQADEDEKAEQTQEKIRMRTHHNVDMWKSIYRRLHEKNRPKLPSERTRKTKNTDQHGQALSGGAIPQNIIIMLPDTPEKAAPAPAVNHSKVDGEHIACDRLEVALPVRFSDSDHSAHRSVEEVTNEIMESDSAGETTPSGNIENSGTSVLSFERLARNILEDILNRTAPSSDTAIPLRNECPPSGKRTVPVKSVSSTVEQDVQHKSSANSGDSKSLRIMKSALSKSNANSQHGSNHRHISFAPNAAQEPVVPTARISTETVDKNCIAFPHQAKPVEHETFGTPSLTGAPTKVKSSASPQNIGGQHASREVVVETTVIPHSDHGMQKAVYVPAKSRSKLEPSSSPSFQGKHSPPEFSESKPLRDRPDFLAARSSEHQIRLLEVDKPSAETFVGVSSKSSLPVRDSLATAADIVTALLEEGEQDGADVNDSKVSGKSLHSVQNPANESKSASIFAQSYEVADPPPKREASPPAIGVDEDEGYVISIPVVSVLRQNNYSNLVTAHSDTTVNSLEPDGLISETDLPAFDGKPTVEEADEIVEKLITTQSSQMNTDTGSDTNLPKLCNSPTFSTALDIIDDLTSHDDMFLNIYSA